MMLKLRRLDVGIKPIEETRVATCNFFLGLRSLQA